MESGSRVGRYLRARPARISPEVEQLLDAWAATPAYLHSRYLDVLAANPLAVALSPAMFTPGTNLLRSAFLDPAVGELYADWEAMTEKATASLRMLAGPNVDDPHLTELVGELSVRSERFRQLWARQDAGANLSGTSRFEHPQFGSFELEYQKLPMPGNEGQMLVVYHTESASAYALSLLSVLATDQPSHTSTREGVSDGFASR